MTAAASIGIRVACLLPLASVVGCGGPSAGETVHGQVTYRGESFGSGSVMFFPDSGRPLSVSLSPSGDYSLELAPGNYVVAINVGVELPPGWKEGDRVPPQRVSLPKEYTSRVHSTLKTTVTKGQTGAVDFHLE